MYRLAALVFILASILVAPATAQQPVVSCAQGVQSGTTIGQAGCALLLKPQTTATTQESNHVFKTSAGVVPDFQVNTGAAAVWIMLIDGTALPSDGTVAGCATPSTTRPCVAKWYQVGTNSTVGVSWSPGPLLWLQSGVVVGCSTTGPFTLTASATCVFSGEVQ